MLLRSLMTMRPAQAMRPALNARFMSTNIVVRDAIALAMEHEMKRDDRVFLIGEEVGAYNGAYKCSKGLFDKFGPERVRDTPITEAGFAGLAVGAGMAGLHPICEFMTWNFSMQAIDHIVNSCAKAGYMSGGQITSPVTFRGPNGPPKAVGAQHSQCFAAWYSSVPGLKVVAPYDAEDAFGLLKAAIRDPNPVVVLESELMYGEAFDVDDDKLTEDWTAPIGKAKTMREGTDVSLIAFGHIVGHSLKAAEELAKEGVSCEVINLRSLRPIDRDAIVETVKKTNRVVTVEEGWAQCGIGAEICAIISETEAFDYLDHPVVRITSADIPMPYAKNIEDASMVQPENIVNVVRRVMQQS